MKLSFNSYNSTSQTTSVILILIGVLNQWTLDSWEMLWLDIFYLKWWKCRNLVIFSCKELSPKQDTFACNRVDIIEQSADTIRVNDLKCFELLGKSRAFMWNFQLFARCPFPPSFHEHNIPYALMWANKSLLLAYSFFLSLEYKQFTMMDRVEAWLPKAPFLMYKYTFWSYKKN